MDSRTPEEFRKQYEDSHYNEELVYKAMKCQKFRLNGERYIGDGGGYEPDCFLLLHDQWVPVEIKATHSENDWQDFKAHQVNRLADIGGVILFATPNRMSIVRASEIKANCHQVAANDSKVNKPAYRCQLTKWAKWDKMLHFK